MTMTVRWMAHDPCSAGSTGRRVERYAEEWVVWLCGWNVRLSIPGIEPLAEGMYSTGALDPVNRYRYLADPCTAVDFTNECAHLNPTISRTLKPKPSFLSTPDRAAVELFPQKTSEKRRK